MSYSIERMLFNVTCLILFFGSIVVAQEGGGKIWTVSLYRQGQKPAAEGVAFTIGLFARTPQLVSVPSLKDLTWEEASQTLSDLGLVAEKINTSGQSSDSVRNQSVAAGTKVQPGTSVRLGLVATVPNIVGMTFSEAYSTLTNEGGFKMKYNQNLSSEFKVTHQQPVAGSVLARGLSVSATCMVQVPSVEGLTVSEARAKLAAAKLNNSLPKVFKETDRVLKQNNTGKTVPALTVVNLIPGVRVPNLVGLSGPAANAELVRTGVKGNARVKSILTQSQFLNGKTTVVGQGFRPGEYIARTQSMNVNLTKYVYVAPKPIQYGNQGGAGNSGTIKNGIKGGNNGNNGDPEYGGGEFGGGEFGGGEFGGGGG